MATKKKPKLNVVTLHEHSLRDVSAKLREIADNIDAGDYGPVTCLGVAFVGNQFYTYSLGDGIQEDSCAPSVATLFRAGALRVEQQIEAHGRTPP